MLKSQIQCFFLFRIFYIFLFEAQIKSLKTATQQTSKRETSTQWRASVVDGGPTLGRCLVFAGNHWYHRGIETISTIWVQRSGGIVMTSLVLGYCLIPDFGIDIHLFSLLHNFIDIKYQYYIYNIAFRILL